ncbi:PhzF family phenazine biosynthesis protein [uncultured Acetobacteroides sp.]|uniref:PhzF family phenazine biosynthesis protein n=1 Tax=uncultured Acetobacteroides sp. TaxID=1760811 RepID=UPI0029F4A532|nr:PhzF family phenazine biosynthesis protein [uncultured Acetobacteroides sp.]
MQAYTLNAFSKSSQGGNPAGVILVADNLSDEEMQQIAAKVGLSETAFVSPSDKANFRVRFFTPVQEVDLCGHATIATFYLMHHLNIIKKGWYTQETNAGILRVEVGDRTVTMEQRPPIFYETIDKATVAKSLNISPNEFMEDLPIQIVSTGLKDIMVPVKSLEAINAIKPDFAEVAAISKMHGAIGYHIFTSETVNGNAAHCRNLAPLYGIDEEAATGSASGALAGYLYKYGMVAVPSKVTFEQGYTMKKPSEIVVELTRKPDGNILVMAGGSTCRIEQIKL